ncbi:ankyrin [Auricularia subglabra TFB-10046 SS5]|uniref:Ankyrin n=1 Tax=Auricularia subglabra (strain TFB-10046 / SS5) TaxID=717982 RepID=J0D1X2_AURST|nr:ankyrin [Auricularia subglabra TFB-10046 SS5]
MTSAAREPQASPSRPGTAGDRPLTVNELPQETLDFASKMFDLARNGETEQLEAYLDAGLPANLTNHTGATLLMLAAYHGHAATVAALVKRGADVNALNDKGQSPLAGAVFKGEEEVVKILVEARADPNAGQPSAMQAATVFNKPQYLELFQQQSGGRAAPDQNAHSLQTVNS